MPFTAGNAVEPLHNGEEIFSAMLEAVREARESVNFLTYVYWGGEVAEALCEALCERARAGLAVRVLLDAIGAARIQRGLIARMREAGVDVRWFRPPSWRFWRIDHRTHRKVLLCDGAVGFTGGVGIAREWEGDARNAEEWREIHFRFHGPSVDGLNAAFWENWIECCPDAEPVLPARRQMRAGDSAVQVVNLHSGGFSRTAPILAQTMTWLARRRLDIATAYLSPDHRTVAHLVRKAQEGVAITLLIPGPHVDTRAEGWEAKRYFQPLLGAGVRIFRYQPSMMHSKLMLVDDDLALIGSVNLNQRSLHRDEEVAAVVQDPVLVERLRGRLHADWDQSEEVDADAWRRLPLGQRLLAGLIRPVRREL